MRLRNVRGAGDRILEDPFTIQTDGADPADYKGLWQKNIFHNNHPIHMEIGMGKGKFITELAKQHPEINYIGVEKYSSVLVRALEKRDALALENLIFVRMDAESVDEFFADGEIDKIYLNFSDPWPKDRHAKRRLTSISHLARYDKVLTENGDLEFKTDNRPLFDFSLEQLEEAGWIKDEVNFDLHKNGPAENNVMTEYEEKFYQLGNPICKLRAHRIKNS